MSDYTVEQNFVVRVRRPVHAEDLVSAGRLLAVETVARLREVPGVIDVWVPEEIGVGFETPLSPANEEGK